MSENLNRRKFLKSSIITSTTAALGLSLEEKALLARATKKPTAPPPKSSTKGLPMGRIGNVNITRLLLYYGLISIALAFSKDIGMKEAARFNGLHRSNQEKPTSNTLRPI
jgi:hypothetical protein